MSSEDRELSEHIYLALTSTKTFYPLPTIGRIVRLLQVKVFFKRGTGRYKTGIETNTSKTSAMV